MAKVELCGFDISKSEKLSDEESLDLLREIKNGSKAAKDRFVLANLKLVLSLAQRFNTRKKDIEDMFEVGIIGLLKAIEGFNCDFEVKFSTYAVPMILGEIRRYVKDNCGIKVPRSLRDIAYKAIVFKQEYELSHDKSPSIYEISKEIKIPIKKIEMAFDSISETISLQDEIFSSDDDSLTIMDQIKDEKNTDENLIFQIALNDGIKTLTKKEKNVLYLRYYYGKTQTEISHTLGVSQAQVSRLEKSAIDRLRYILTS